MCGIDDTVKVLNDDGCYCQMKLYESQRPWKLDNENLKSRCKQLSDELGRHKQLLATTQDVSCFSLLCLCASVHACVRARARIAACLSVSCCMAMYCLF